MRASGIVRKIDSLGRITLPKELRRKLGINEQDRLGFYVEGDSIILMLEDKAVCVFCGGDEHLSLYADKHVCWNCLNSLSGTELRDTAV